MSKTNWHQYFMNIATVVASRATCDRASVGAVLVKNRRILAMGYNGAPAGAPECGESGHLMIDGHCRKVLHSEINAIVNAARVGVAIECATCYCTLEPCYECTKALVNAGVQTIIYKEPYKKDAEFLMHGVYVKTTDPHVFDLIRALYNCKPMGGTWSAKDCYFTTLHNMMALDEHCKNVCWSSIKSLEFAPDGQFAGLNMYKESERID